MLYLGADLATSASEVFGEDGEALLCPRWRVALLRPAQPLRVLDLIAPGTAMKLGGLPSIADGPHPRVVTQQWARAVYEDQPAGPEVSGIRYTSAYNGGTALVLWDSTGRVQTVSVHGVAQDFALREDEVLTRLTAAMTSRQITLTSADTCPRCP